MRLRIFVIVKEDSIRESMRLHLQDQGHEVVAISEPRACKVYNQKACNHQHPCGDILFIDHSFPRMSGLDFIAEMIEKGCKGLTRNKVVMANSATEADFRRAEQLGCVLLKKPVTLCDIDTLIASMQQRIPKGRKLSRL